MPVAAVRLQSLRCATRRQPLRLGPQHKPRSQACTHKLTLRIATSLPASAAADRPRPLAPRRRRRSWTWPAGTNGPKGVRFLGGGGWGRGRQTLVHRRSTTLSTHWTQSTAGVGRREVAMAWCQSFPGSKRSGRSAAAGAQPVSDAGRHAACVGSPTCLLAKLIGPRARGQLTAATATHAVADLPVAWSEQGVGYNRRVVGGPMAQAAPRARARGPPHSLPLTFGRPAFSHNACLRTACCTDDGSSSPAVASTTAASRRSPAHFQSRPSSRSMTRAAATQAPCAAARRRRR